MVTSLRPTTSFSLIVITLVATMATFVQAFVYLKLVLLAAFLLVAVLHAWRWGLVLHARLVWFYLAMCVAGAAWAVVGLLNPGNYVEGVMDGLRLYVAWSAVFLVVFSLLRRAAGALKLLHTAMVVAAIAIPLVNFVGIWLELSGSGLIPEDAREQMQLYVGFHDGYLRINSINIGALFLILPYLFTLAVRSDAPDAHPLLTRLALLLSTVLALLSGRRALWLVVGLFPLIVVALATVTRTWDLVKPRARRFLLVCGVAALVGAAGLTALLKAPVGSETGPLSHLQAAFSEQDERSIQKDYLVDAFMSSPFLGTGFGAYLGYQRNEERPWTYELTYWQLLANTGVLGFTFLAVLLGTYGALVVGLLRRHRQDSAVPFGVLVGLCSLLVGAHSNPYLRSFEFLFFLGLLPYVSTHLLGFSQEDSDSAPPGLTLPVRGRSG